MSEEKTVLSPEAPAKGEEKKSEPTAEASNNAKVEVKVKEKKAKPVAKSKAPAKASTDISALKKRKRKTEYGTQLEEKQVAKELYGIRERQFRNYYKKAIRQKGDTGDILRQMLQMRLDNVVFQSGYTKTIRQARQLVSHNYFFVNGKKVNIPSYEVKPKDIITLKPGKEAKKVFNEEMAERMKDHQTPGWIVFDKKTKTAKILNKPTEQELEQSFNSRLIVEFYSR